MSLPFKNTSHFANANPFQLRLLLSSFQFFFFALSLTYSSYEFEVNEQINFTRMDDGFCLFVEVKKNPTHKINDTREIYNLMKKKN